MNPKEIYNYLGAGQDPIESVAMATVFIKLFWFWDFVLGTYPFVSDLVKCDP